MKKRHLAINISRQNLLEWLAWPVGMAVAFVGSIYLANGFLWLLYQAHFLTNLNGTVLTLAQRVLVYALTMAIVLGATLWLRRALSRRDMGLWRLPDWRDIGLSLVGMVAYFALTSALLFIAQQIPGFDVNQAQDTGLGRLFSLDLMMAFLVIVVATPFFEEWMFRGALYGGLRRAKMPFWATTLLVSLLFGLAHMQ